MTLFKQLLGVFAVLAVLASILMIFVYDVVKIDWVVFMENQPSFKPMENPLPPPARSIPIEGPISIPGMGAPENPTTTDEASVTRGAELYSIHCAMCHGATAEGNGPIGAFLIKYKPANLQRMWSKPKAMGRSSLRSRTALTSVCLLLMKT